MYKLLLVDDEPDILNGMARGIPWNSWGFIVIGQASDGLEALKLIEKEQPHVVLSDICMPMVDGMELMQELHDKYPEIRVIILSGYSDFEYMKVAIKNRVAEYLLKPTDLDEFETTFRKIRRQLDEAQIQEEKMEDLKQQAREAQDFQYARIINDLIRGYVSDGNDFMLADALGITFRNCVVILLDLHRETDEEPGELPKERRKIVRYCNMRETDYHSFFYINFSDQLTGIVELPEEEMDWKSVILKYLQELQSEIQDLYHIKLSAGVSNICRQISRLYRSYEQAVSSARQKIFMGTLSIVFYPDLDMYGNTMYDIHTFEIERLKQHVVVNDMDALKGDIGKVLIQFKNRMLKDYSYIDRISLEALYQMSRWALATYQIRLEEIMDKNEIHYVDIQKLTSLNGKEQFLLTVLDLLSKEIKENQESGKIINSLAKLVKDYVDKEFCTNQISLDFVAEKVKKNSAYLSKLFKRETGYNFSDYITQMRMEKSKELLKDHSLKVYNIAEKTGYADVSNFIKVFRKYFGVSPNEYRNIHGGSMND